MWGKPLVVDDGRSQLSKWKGYYPFAVPTISVRKRGFVTVARLFPTVWVMYSLIKGKTLAKDATRRFHGIEVNWPHVYFRDHSLQWNINYFVV